MSLAPSIADFSRRYIEDGLGWRYRPGVITRYIREANSEVVVAKHEGQLVGFAVAEFHAVHAHLVLLAVRPGYRRCGMGRRLMEWLECMAINAGTFQVVLEVRAGRTDAREFYKELGYRAVRRLRGYHLGREDAVRMERNLTIS